MSHQLDPNIEPEETGENIHYALRLENTNGKINNGFPTTAFKCFLINSIPTTKNICGTARVYFVQDN
jgi:hypothetical protein